jgi:hypothetical protein
MIRPMRKAALIVALAAVALCGCGAEPLALSRSSADELHAQVEAVRTAAAGGDREKALEELDGLAGRVRDLEAAGSIAAGDAAALRRGIGRAKRRVRAEVAAAGTPAPTPSATATPEPPPPTGPGKGKGKGKAKGHGKGDEQGDQD